MRQTRDGRLSILRSNHNLFDPLAPVARQFIRRLRSTRSCERPIRWLGPAAHLRTKARAEAHPSNLPKYPAQMSDFKPNSIRTHPGGEECHSDRRAGHRPVEKQTRWLAAQNCDCLVQSEQVILPPVRSE